jgi:hypothetical protein
VASFPALFVPLMAKRLRRELGRARNIRRLRHADYDTGLAPIMDDASTAEREVDDTGNSFDRRSGAAWEDTSGAWWFG